MINNIINKIRDSLAGQTDHSGFKPVYGSLHKSSVDETRKFPLTVTLARQMQSWQFEALLPPSAWHSAGFFHERQQKLRQTLPPAAASNNIVLYLQSVA